ncbi:uncharacterized protein PRCAT00000411001 [Priceomyces carsonii]|uniref:uncharacterized protein n=1 Tax=Priceomyces carsonii TaxID=28549 RepID=UPI002ED818BC|nr:unnamed protein product [Priceomyces carsonii]
MSGSFTKEQEQIVLKVLSFEPHQFYEILSVEKTANDSEIKKSYRRLAVKLHPDKNSHPKASEAFKYLNKAWGILSDPSKKKLFDQTGADPDSRFAASSSGADMFETSPFARSSGFSSFQGGNVFEDDIFNLFFGGGAPGSTFTFGNNGFTFQSFGGGDPFFGPNVRTSSRRQQRTRPQPQRQQEEPNIFNTLKAIFPFFLFLLVPLISSFFSESVPDYSFQKTRQYNVQRATPRYKIPYFVSRTFTEKDMTAKQLKNFDFKVEKVYIQDKRSKCSREQILKSQLIEDAQGWFYTDVAKLNEAENLPMPNCQKLRDLNLI